MISLRRSGSNGSFSVYEEDMALSVKDIENLRNQLESWGESKVREQLTARRFGEGDAAERTFVEDWLRGKEAAREAETLSIAREALSNSEQARSEARKANTIAI